jgi:hypothetical protein
MIPRFLYERNGENLFQPSSVISLLLYHVLKFFVMTSASWKTQKKAYPSLTKLTKITVVSTNKGLERTECGTKPMGLVPVESPLLFIMIAPAAPVTGISTMQETTQRVSLFQIEPTGIVDAATLVFRYLQSVNIKVNILNDSMIEFSTSFCQSHCTK